MSSPRHNYLVDVVADGAFHAQHSDGETTWPVLSQDERGYKQARLIAASVLDALMREGILDRDVWGDSS